MYLIAGLGTARITEKADSYSNIVKDRQVKAHSCSNIVIDHWTVISFEGEICAGEIILLLATSLKLSMFTGICLIFIGVFLGNFTYMYMRV